MIDLDPATLEQEQNGPAPAPPAAEEGGWRRDKAGKEYIPRQSGRGINYRQGEETVEQAQARDLAAGKDRDERPSRARKGKASARKPPPPQKADLKELEPVLAEALTSPAMICAAFGDEWAANHFVNQGPLLARNLVVSAQHNPWLRKKLEKAASGEEMTMQLMSMVGVAGALVGYAIPPLVWWLNLPLPNDARKLFNIPDRREHAPSPPPPPETAAFSAAA
ncbi:MAG TPA: hypothetical protein VFI54_06375 [Solirubrobacteraceae bacterium]|nr:hypothetical protein [Solirubrobacteraceae bacterium]